MFFLLRIVLRLNIVMIGCCCRTGSGCPYAQILTKTSLQIFAFLTCYTFDRFFSASPILDRCIEAGVICDDHKPAVLVFADAITQLGNKLEIQRVSPFITFDEGHCPGGFLEPDQTVIAHMRTVSRIKNNQLSLFRRQFKKGDPEIPDIFAVY